MFHTARRFFEMEAAGGILLVVASLLALVLANSPWGGFYNYLFNEIHFRISFLDTQAHFLEVEKSLLHWINDGMMAIFFLLVGLEIKREMVLGELSAPSKALLPVIAAIGWMAFMDVEHQATVRLGVLAGSFISALADYIVLRYTAGKVKNP